MKAQHDRQFIKPCRGNISVSLVRAIRLRAVVLCVLALFSASFVTATQHGQDEETTRKLWDTAFGETKKSARSGRSGTRRVYRVATPRVSPVSGDSVVGVTIWRLRPSRDTDEGERMLVHDGANEAAWIPERVPANAGLSEGDRVRLSIEAARTGYLYVIDREQYSDGTLGEPYLIFPTMRTLGGNNSVKAGRLVDVPAQDDGPPFFTLKRSRADQVGELLTVIVTKAPLDEIQIGATAQRLSAERVAQWEKTWGGQIGRLDLKDGANRLWTPEEKAAGASAEHILKASAPKPQTLYYRPDVRPGAPFLVQVRLQYRRRARLSAQQ